MRVFRVQHMTRNAGPYTYNKDTTEDEKYLDICDELADAHYDDEDRPICYNDGMGYPDSRDMYAGPSIEWLSRWFDGFGVALNEEDFLVAEYEIDKPTDTGNSGQIMFRASNATLVATHKINWS